MDMTTNFQMGYDQTEGGIRQDFCSSAVNRPESTQLLQSRSFQLWKKTVHCNQVSDSKDGKAI